MDEADALMYDFLYGSHAALNEGTRAGFCEQDYEELESRLFVATDWDKF